MPLPPSPDLTAAAELIVRNYHRLFAEALVPNVAPTDEAAALFDAPFVMLSALGTFGSDNVFNYANRTALTLFEADWNDLVGHPSSASAEPVHREERRRLLDEVGRNGFIRNYSGIRISRRGRRFRILQATVFNLLDEDENYVGQAATFSRWEPI